MPWLIPDKLIATPSSLISKNGRAFSSFLILICLIFSSCGRVYFPIELNTSSRSDRSEKQENSVVKVIPMTSKSIKLANATPYKRQITEAGNLNEPAKLVSASSALLENFPKTNDPGPYLIGVGDVIGYEEVIAAPGSLSTSITRSLIVNEQGLINFFQLGRIRANNKTLSELEDSILTKVLETGGNQNFNLFIREFRSKEVLISSDGVNIVSIPYSSNPMYIEQVLKDVKVSKNLDAKISIFRGGDEYVFSYKKLIMSTGNRVRLFPGDKIFVNILNYRPEKVLLVGETGAQRAISINSIVRPSLSDAIFSGNILNSITSDFSQIYVLRKKPKMFHAYHLDITNPTRVSLASEFEMRPDDIVFVATQPLSLYSRTLSQILGSTGLTLQARDTIRTEIGN